MFAVLVLLLIRNVFCELKSEKRLVFHSETDIAQEIFKINQKIENLTTLLTQKDKEISDLTRSSTAKDKEIVDLNITLNELKRSSTAKDKDIVGLNITLNELTRSSAKKEKDIEELKKAVEMNTECGSTYVRWGRTSCATNGTELVYSGYMASSCYDNTGGGSNLLCLASDPQWSYYDESITSGTRLKGVEYQFFPHHYDGAAKFFGHNVLNDDATCAVCHSRRGSSMMIPGRTDCYNGWTKEYSGYLVSSHDDFKHESEFICLDNRPESVVGGHNDDDESVLYFVEASCGKSLECPPYINGREITCVVCTK